MAGSRLLALAVAVAALVALFSVRAHAKPAFFREAGFSRNHVTTRGGEAARGKGKLREESGSRHSEKLLGRELKDESAESASTEPAEDKEVIRSRSKPTFWWKNVRGKKLRQKRSAADGEKSAENSVEVPATSGRVSGKRLKKVAANVGRRALAAEGKERPRAATGNSIMRRAGVESRLGKVAIDSSAAGKRVAGYDEAPLSKDGFVPMGRVTHTFVRFSAYRNDLSSFFVIGLSSEFLEGGGGAPVRACHWREGRYRTQPLRRKRLLRLGTIAAVAVELTYADNLDRHGYDYRVTVVKCSFGQSVGVNGKGTLYLEIPTRIGNLVAGTVNETEFVPVFHQTALDYQLYVPRMSGELPKYRYKYAMCGAPMRETLNATIIQQWITWYRVLFQDNAHFFFYVTEFLGKDLQARLDEWSKLGILTVIDVRGQSQYDGWYFNQLLFLNDCVHRSRHLARWTLNLDFDEFLYAHKRKFRSKNMDDFLATWEDAPAVLFGSWDYYIGLCQPVKSTSPIRWPIENMVWRRRRTCTPVNCHMPRKKWCLNPERVFMVQIHNISSYTPTDASPVFVLGTTAFVAHFQGLAKRGNAACELVTDHPERHLEELKLSRHILEKPIQRNHILANEVATMRRTNKLYSLRALSSRDESTGT